MWSAVLQLGRLALVGLGLWSVPETVKQATDAVEEARKAERLQQQQQLAAVRLRMIRTVAVAVVSLVGLYFLVVGVFRGKKNRR